MWPGYGDHMGLMGLWWIIGLAVVVALVWVAARGTGWTGTPPDDSPETILKRRYARGEIDRDEFSRRLTDLRR